MKIDVRFDATGLKALTPKVSKNMLYSTVQGINDTSKQVQAAERAELVKQLVLRTPNTKRFLTNNVAKITFASVKQGRVYGEVFINSKSKNLLLSALAVGGVKREPVRGSVIAQPITGAEARPSKQASVAKPLTFVAMKLKKVGDSYRGKNGTFTIAGDGVYKRLNRDEIEKIYDFRREQTIKQDLDWMNIAKKTVNKNIVENISKRFYR